MDINYKIDSGFLGIFDVLIASSKTVPMKVFLEEVRQFWSDWREFLGLTLLFVGIPNPLIYWSCPTRLASYNSLKSIFLELDFDNQKF